MPGSKRYFEFETDSGVVLIETSATVGGMGAVGNERVVQKTGEAFKGVLASLEGIIVPLQEQVRDRLKDASEVSVEFGVKLAGKAGLIVAESELEGNFKVSIKWTKP